MHDIKDYIKMVANSMSVDLDEEKLTRITHQLLDHKDYNKMLVHLENMIMFEK